MVASQARCQVSVRKGRIDEFSHATRNEAMKSDDLSTNLSNSTVILTADTDIVIFD